MLIYPSLVLVQPRKTCPCLTERLLMGRKESIKQKKRRVVPPFQQCMYKSLVKIPPLIQSIAQGNPI